MSQSDVEDNATSSSYCWHVIQPHRVTWNSILDHLNKAGLKFKRKSTADWLQSLRGSSQDPSVNPSIKLLSFWENKYGQLHTSSDLRLPLHETKLTRQNSETMSSLEEQTYESTLKWIRHWRETGFLSASKEMGECLE